VPLERLLGGKRTRPDEIAETTEFFIKLMALERRLQKAESLLILTFLSE